MGKKKENITSSSLEDLIEKSGGCAVIDGGFATQLEKHGASINDPLWSALCLITQPHLIKAVSFFSTYIYIFLLLLSCLCIIWMNFGLAGSFRLPGGWR